MAAILNRRNRRALNRRLGRPRNTPLLILTEWKTEILREWEENGVKYNSHRHYFSITCAVENAHVHIHDTDEDTGGGGYCGVGVNHDHTCTVNAGSDHNHVFSGWTGVTAASDLNHTHTIGITSQDGSGHTHNLPANWSSGFCTADGCEADPHNHVAGGANADGSAHTHGLNGATGNGVGLLRWHTHPVNFNCDTGSAHTHLVGTATITNAVCHTGYDHNHGGGVEESSAENVHIHTVDGDTDEEGEPIDGSEALYAYFEVGQDSENLYADAEIQHSASSELYGYAEIKNTSSVEIYAHVIIKNVDSKELYGHAIIKHATSAELYGHAIIKNSDSAEIYGHAIIRQESSVEIYAHAIIKNASSKELYGYVTIRNASSAEVYGHAVIRHETSVEVYGHAVIRHETSVELYGYGIIKNASSAELYANVTIIHWIDLLGVTTIRHTATPLELPARLWVRFPPRLWTNRRYINGVIDLDEKLLGDAVLEYVIEGVMEDIQGYLDNADLSYSDWTNITLIPIQILRATTYGVVAALYARHTQTFKSRVIQSITPVRPTVIGDTEKAMNYWEDRLNKMLELYVSSQGGLVMDSSTADEEPVFTMTDIPEQISDYVPWRSWLQQRDG